MNGVGTLNSEGAKLVERMSEIDAEIAELIAEKLSMQRDYDAKIAKLRAKVARIDAIYRRKHRCVAEVRVFIGYALNRNGFQVGPARYQRRRCLNSALAGDYICGVHERANRMRAAKATELEGAL